MAQSRLLALPEELLLVIADDIEPGSILQFALTCKETFVAAKARLQGQRALHEQFRLQHDRPPLAVSQLLQLALYGGDAAWHVRALELWGHRPGWKKWKSWHLSYSEETEEDPDWPDVFEDHSNLAADFYKPRDLEKYEDIMHNTFKLNEYDVEAWMIAIRDGWDEPIKGMLIALLPNLDRCNFIAYDSWQGNEHHDTHPFHFLCLSIKRIADTPGALWPPGFRSLRQVSVCTTTSLRHPHDAYYAPAADVAPLYFLPNIKVLHFTLLGYTDDGDEAELILPPRCSSVEELAFSCCDIAFDQLETMIRASRSLRSLTVDTSSGQAQQVLDVVSTEYSESLEIFRLCSRQGDEFEPAALRRLVKLKTLQGLPLSNVLPNCHKRWQTGMLAGAIDEQSLRDVRPLQESLPVSIERVQLQSDNAIQEVVESHRLLLQAVADLATDARYASLKEVCLYDIITTPRSGQPFYEKSTTDFWWDEELYQSIQDNKVDLHRYGKDGQGMKYAEEEQLHHNFSNGKLTIVESDPRPLEDRY